MIFLDLSTIPVPSQNHQTFSIIMLTAITVRGGGNLLLTHSAAQRQMNKESLDTVSRAA